MAELEAIQTVDMQVPIQAAMAAVMVKRHRHGGPALRQPSFIWNALDEYVKLLSFEMEITNILQTKTYK